jgi:hypothetical protein
MIMFSLQAYAGILGYLIYLFNIYNLVNRKTLLIAYII